MTTPTSSVFVQRSFGHTSPAPVSQRTLKRQIKRNQTREAGPEVTEAAETVLSSLHGAVDVLTRSSQGYMSVPDDTELSDEILENDIESLQKEIELLQKDIQSLDEAEITFDLTDEENIDEVISLQQNLDSLVQGLTSLPDTQNVEEKTKFQHFPVINVENIYDKNAIENILVDFTDKDSENTIIQSNQFDDILLANYLRNNQNINEPTSLVKDSSSSSSIPKTVIPKQSVEVIHGKPIDRVNGPINTFPRAEKLVSIPDTVSNIMTSVNSAMNFNNNQAKKLTDHKAQVPKLRPAAGYKPPTTTEKLRPQDGAVRSHLEIGQSGADYVQYINSPSLGRDRPRPQQMTHVFSQGQQQRPYSEDSEDKVDMVEEAEDIQKFWPGSRINATYQANWIG